MPRPKTITLTMTASDDDAICQAQTPGGAGALTLNGALVSSSVATLDVPRHLLLTATADESTKTVTITGTDRYGNALSIATTLPNATTKIVTGYNFKTVTGIAIDAATANTIKVGTANSLDSQWIPMDWKKPVKSTVTVDVSTGGNFTYALQSTVDHVQATGFVESSANPFDVSIMTGTTDAMALLDGPVRAIRLGISSFVSGTATMIILTQG